MTIVILGSDGFVGRNLYEDLASDRYSDGTYSCYGSSRKVGSNISGMRTGLTGSNRLFFDLADPASWDSVSTVRPDCLINCIGYGVVKDQTDVKDMIDINYLQTARFYEYMSTHCPDTYLIHLGTAFEYYLAGEGLTESSECTPQTYYGISKRLISDYLLHRNPIKNFTILRPFNMFGPYENGTKIIPALIGAQRQKKPLPLTDGGQQRDYFFVKDLSMLIKELIGGRGRDHKIINVGSGRPLSLRRLAEDIARQIEGFDEKWWEWGKLPQRPGESAAFYNASDRAAAAGLTLTGLKEALSITIKHYWNV